MAYAVPALQDMFYVPGPMEQRLDMVTERNRPGAHGQSAQNVGLFFDGFDFGMCREFDV